MAEAKMPNKADIVMELEEIAATRLFGPSFRSWLMDRQTNNAMHRRLIDLGLVQEIDNTGIYVNTPLGMELHAELLEVFMGNFDPFNGLEMLKTHGLVDDSTFKALLNNYEHIGDNDEWLERLHGVVKKAYPAFLRAISGAC